MQRRDHTQQRAVAVDAHVHLHEGVPGRDLVARWARNFALCSGARTRTGMLMLSEMAGCRVFDALRQSELFHPTDEPESLRATVGEWTLLVVAGRQIVSAEGLEVLALATERAFPDGQPLEQTIAAIEAANGLPVLPWGAGKWLGRRGARIAALIEASPPDRLFFGDNGGRPRLWRSPLLRRAQERGFRVVSGTDPLPLPGEAGRIGRFGFTLAEPLAHDRPAAAFRQMLRDPACAVRPYGALCSLSGFAAGQTMLRMRRQTVAAA